MFTYYLLWLSVMFSLLLATRSPFPFCRHSGGGGGSGRGSSSSSSGQQSVRPFARMRTTSNAASLAGNSAVSGLSRHFALSDPALPCVSASPGPAFSFLFSLISPALSSPSARLARPLSPFWLRRSQRERVRPCGERGFNFFVHRRPAVSQPIFQSLRAPIPHGYPLNGCLSLLLLVSVLRLLPTFASPFPGSSGSTQPHTTSSITVFPQRSWLRKDHINYYNNFLSSLKVHTYCLLSIEFIRSIVDYHLGGDAT